MQINLIIILVSVSLFLIFLTTYILKKGRIAEKYALLWYAMSLSVMLIACFPNIFTLIAKKLGFYPMSSFIMGIFILVLLIITMALTVMIAGQKKKTTMLIQEISILKKEINELKRGNK